MGGCNTWLAAAMQRDAKPSVQLQVALGQHMLCRLFMWVLWYLIWSTSCCFCLLVFVCACVSLTSSNPYEKNWSVFTVSSPSYYNFCFKSELCFQKTLFLVCAQQISRHRFVLLQGKASNIPDQIRQDMSEFPCASRRGNALHMGNSTWPYVVFAVLRVS